MIERLKKEEIPEAVNVYAKGLSMEIPKGYVDFPKINEKLKNLECFIYKKEGKIVGLVSFYIKNNNVFIDFVCSLHFRQGIGKSLIRELAKFALDKKIEFIFSNVSTQDERAMKFYESCGFEKYGEFAIDKDLTLNKIRVKPQYIIKN